MWEELRGPTDRKEADGWRLSKHCFTVTPACGEQYFLSGDFSGSQKGPGTECFCRAITGPLWFKQEGTELFLLTDFDPAAWRLSEKATEITGGSSACFSWEVNAVCLSLTSWPGDQHNRKGQHSLCNSSSEPGRRSHLYL